MDRPKVGILVSTEGGMNSSSVALVLLAMTDEYSGKIGQRGVFIEDSK